MQTGSNTRSKAKKSARAVLGKQGEERVASMLEKKGFTIVEKNYRQRFGEIDLIAQKGNLLVFVEVKTRRSATFDVSQVVTRSKQKKIIMVAQYYLAGHTNDERACRFDVAVIEHEGGEIIYIPDAFTTQNY